MNTRKTILATRSWGRGRPSVVFLHGFMGSAGDWEAVAGVIADAFPCVAIELPGHGGSLHISDAEAYTVAGAARLVGETMKHQGIDEAVLVGYSMGGRIALELAARGGCPGLSGLVLESAGSGIGRARERAERLALDRLRAEAIRRDYRSFLDEWHAMPLFKSLHRDPDIARRLVEERMANDAGEMARVVVGMSPGAAVAADPRKISVPTLLVAGALDSQYVSSSHRLAGLVPEASTEIVPGAGHNVHREKPDHYVNALERFLHRTFREVNR